MRTTQLLQRTCASEGRLVAATTGYNHHHRTTAAAALVAFFFGSSGGGSNRSASKQAFTRYPPPVPLCVLCRLAALRLYV